MTTERKVDHEEKYKPGSIGDSRNEVPWWPTSCVVRYFHRPDATRREVEQAQYTLFIGISCFATLMLYTVGWHEGAAIAVWNAVCGVSWLISVGVSIAKESSAPLRNWIAGASLIFIVVNYFACGCQPQAVTGGRFFVVTLFGLASLIGTGIEQTPTLAVAAVHILMYLVFSILEGAGVRCYATELSSVHIIAQVFCQLAFPLASICYATINRQLSWDREAIRFEASEGFSRSCVRHALAGDIEALAREVQQFDETVLKNTLPTMCDDALSVVVDLLQKTAKSMEDLRAKRPSSRSPSQQGLLAVPQNANNSSSDEDASAGGGRRRRSTRLLSLDINTSPILPPFPQPEKGLIILCMYSLPNLPKYAEHPNSNVDLVKLFLTEFVDHCRTATTRYGGILCFASFDRIFARFYNAPSAVAASLCLVDLLNKAKAHYPDPAIGEARTLVPLCVVLQARSIIGTFGTGAAHHTATIGCSESDSVFGAILSLRREAKLERSEVVVPVSMKSALETSFSLKESTPSSLCVVSAAKKKDTEGFPLLPPTGDAVTVNVPVYSLPEIIVSSTRENSISSAPLQHVGSESINSAMEKSDRKAPPKRNSFRGLPMEVEAAWTKFDVDGNGTLDVEECRAILEDLGYKMTEEDMRAFFDEVDKDHSGTISKEEFAGAFANPNLGGAHVMDKIKKAGTLIGKSRGGDIIAVVLEAWQKYDKDNSGTLDYTELACLLTDMGMAQSEQELDWLVLKLDRDGSGVVDFEEFSRLFTNDTVTRQIAAKARTQVVTRVINNKSSGVVYSNDDQLLRDERVYYSSLAERYCIFPLFVYIAYNCGSITFNIALGDLRETPSKQIIVDLCLDIFLVTWTFVKYMYLPREEKGQLRFHRKEVVMHALRTPDFYIDMLAVLPLDFIYLGVGTPANGGDMAYYRCNKLLLYWYLDDCYKVITKDLSPAFSRALNAIVVFASIAHMFVCFLVGLVRSLGEDGPGVSDLVGYSTFLSSETMTYPIGLYWAIITLIGQCRGMIIPLQDKALALMFISTLVGLSMFSVVVGTIAQSVKVEDSYTRFLGKIDQLRSYFQYTRLPESIENECIAYYRHLYFTTGSLDITENPLNDLPVELSIQVVIQIGQEMLRKVPIFQDASKNLEFVHELTSKLVPEVVPPLTTVMKKGERGTNMYFITFGDFNILADNGTVVFTLKKGNFFGEIALLHNVKRTATIQSFNKFANVLSLDKKDFDEVTATFPDCLSQVYKAAEDRIKQILDREAEEARQAKLQRQQEREAKRLANDGVGSGNSSSSDDETAADARKPALAKDLQQSQSVAPRGRSASTPRKASMR